MCHDAERTDGREGHQPIYFTNLWLMLLLLLLFISIPFLGDFSLVEEEERHGYAVFYGQGDIKCT